VSLLSTALGTVACRRGSNPGPDTRSLPVIRDNAGLLFTFFDNHAQMRTVDRMADVAKESREAVMVTRLGGGLPGDRIFVTNLDKMDKKGAYPVWVEERGRWLDRVMPRTSVAKLEPPPPQKQRRRRRRRTPRATPGRAPAAPSDTAASAGGGGGEGAQQAADPQNMPKVVMFSTTWCPSCKSARTFFAQKGVRFIDLDVEQNQAAAQKMVEIQKAQGLKVGAVPLIVVGNRIYQGFSQMQIESALAQLPNA